MADIVANAFELSARNLTNEDQRTFEIGDSFFTQNWVAAPASTEARDGLGPTLNAQSCSSCMLTMAERGIHRATMTRFGGCC